jgi:hypothetical protein
LHITNLEGKISVGGKEGNAFREDAEDGNGKVASIGKETVVKHAILLHKGLVKNQTASKG